MMQNDEIASVGLEDEQDLFKWSVVINGPTDTLYEVRLHHESDSGLTN